MRAGGRARPAGRSLGAGREAAPEARERGPEAGERGPGRPPARPGSCLPADRGSANAGGAGRAAPRGLLCLSVC